MLREYSLTKSESLVQFSATVAELQHFFLGIVFIGAPCTEPVPLKYGKIAIKYPWLYKYFLQCRQL